MMLARPEPDTKSHNQRDNRDNRNEVPVRVSVLDAIDETTFVLGRQPEDAVRFVEKLWILRQLVGILNPDARAMWLIGPRLSFLFYFNVEDEYLRDISTLCILNENEGTNMEMDSRKRVCAPKREHWCFVLVCLQMANKTRHRVSASLYSERLLF